MTFKEKLILDGATDVENTILDCCPKDFGYEKGCMCYPYTPLNDDECRACWDREMPTKNPAPAETVTDDPVNHPAHYTAGGIECIDAIRAMLCSYKNPEDAFLAGQVIKYVWRAPLKGKYLQDFEKANFYLTRLINRVKERGEQE